MADWRLALRQLLRTPGFTFIAVLTLALGIAVNTTIVAVVNALVFRPAAVAMVDDVYYVRTGGPGLRSVLGIPFGSLDLLSTTHPDPVVAAVHVYATDTVVQIPGLAEGIGVEAVAGDYQEVFNVRAQFGRWIDRDDQRGVRPNVVLSDRLWRAWLSGDPSAPGRTTVKINNQALTVVGIAPKGFRGLDRLSTTDAWLADSTWHRLADLGWGTRVRVRTELYGRLFIRTRPATPPGAVEAATLTAIAVTTDTPEPTLRAIAVPANDVLRPSQYRAVGLGILSLASLVLIAACANLANMLYARGTKRVGEIAVRLALGASPSRIFRLIATESVIIAVVASVAGLAIAIVALQLTGSASDNLLRPKAGAVRTAVDLSPDWRLAMYAFGAGVFAALAVGFTTAWRASRVAPLRSLSASGLAGHSTARGGRTRLALVAVQVTAAVLLTMATGLYVRRAMDALDTRVLFDTSRVTAARIDLSLHDYTTNGDYNATRGRAFYQRVLANVRRLPGASHAALADGLPGHAYVSKPDKFLLVPEKGTSGHADQVRRITGAYAGVSAGFTESLGLRILRGRSLVASDGDDGPVVAVIAQSAATRLWPGEDAVGKRLMFGSDGLWRTVIGVVSDPIWSAKDNNWSCQSCVAFVPWEQRHRPQMIVMVSSDNPAAQVEPLRAAIREADAEVAILEAAPLDDSLLAWSKPVRAATWLMTWLGLVALTISTLGVYGVVSYFVSARTREFGIRLALGATPGRIVTTVLNEAVHLMLIGLLPGVFLAAIGSRIAQAQIATLMPNDIPTWFVVPMLILVVGLIAGYIPARRASRIDPYAALREL